MTLHPSYIHPTYPLNYISTFMRGVSGLTKFTITTKWQGNITSKTISGRNSWNWPGLNMQEQGNSISATYGSGGCKLSVDGKSMNVVFVGRVFPEQEVKEEKKAKKEADGEGSEEEAPPIFGTAAAESSRMGRAAAALPEGVPEEVKEEDGDENGDGWEIVEPPPTYGEAMRDG